jgi:hypothetical protein
VAFVRPAFYRRPGATRGYKARAGMVTLLAPHDPLRMLNGAERSELSSDNRHRYFTVTHLMVYEQRADVNGEATPRGRGRPCLRSRCR